MMYPLYLGSLWKWPPSEKILLGIRFVSRPKQKYSGNLSRESLLPEDDVGARARNVSSRAQSDAGVKPGREKSAGIGDLERMLNELESPQRVCLKLAQILRVRHNEVALLRLEHGSLRFIVPAELRAAGVIPLTGAAVAARTAATRTPLLSNSFARVKHVSLFESVKLGTEKTAKARSSSLSRKSFRSPWCNSMEGSWAWCKSRAKGSILRSPERTSPGRI